MALGSCAGGPVLRSFTLCGPSVCPRPGPRWPRGGRVSGGSLRGASPSDRLRSSPCLRLPSWRQCLALLLSHGFTFPPHSLNSLKERERRACSGLCLQERRQRTDRAELGFERDPLLVTRKEVEGCARQRATGGSARWNTGLQMGRRVRQTAWPFRMVLNSRLSLNFTAMRSRLN